MIGFTAQLLLAQARQLQPCLHALCAGLAPPAPYAEIKDTPGAYAFSVKERPAGVRHGVHMQGIRRGVITFTAQLLLAQARHLQPCLHALCAGLACNIVHSTQIKYWLKAAKQGSSRLPYVQGIRRGVITFTAQLLLAQARQLQPCLHALCAGLAPPAPLAMTAEAGSLEADEAGRQLQTELVTAIVRVSCCRHMSCM